MKIALFSDTFPPQINGVSNSVYKSALALSKQNHDVCLFTVRRRSKQSKENFCTDINHEKLHINILPSMPFWGYAGERITLPLGFTANKIKKFNPDIIHSHTPFGVGWEAIISAKLLKIPVVGTHHTFYDHYLKYLHIDLPLFKKFSWRYTIAYYNRCDLILSPSNSLAQSLKHHGLKKPVETLSNFIDTNFFVPAADAAAKKKLKNKLGVSDKSLIYVGRLSYEKSIDQIMRALVIISRKNPSTKLIIAGDGPARQMLEKLAHTLKIEKNVCFLGFICGQNLLETLQTSDIFITSSKSENMPLSILEAMSVGLPIIGANALGIPEIIKNNYNGFLVPPDKPEIMAQKISELINNDSLIKKFSAASRALALEYSQDKIVKSLENIYNKLINNKQ